MPNYVSSMINQFNQTSITKCDSVCEQIPHSSTLSELVGEIGHQLTQVSDKTFQMLSVAQDVNLLVHHAHFPNGAFNQLINVFQTQGKNVFLHDHIGLDVSSGFLEKYPVPYDCKNVFLQDQESLWYREYLESGNCKMFATFAFKELVSRLEKCPVFIYNLENQNHTLAIAGDIRDRRWGENSVVIDPWQLFPKAHLVKHLNTALPTLANPVSVFYDQLQDYQDDKWLSMSLLDSQHSFNDEDVTQLIIKANQEVDQSEFQLPFIGEQLAKKMAGTTIPLHSVTSCINHAISYESSSKDQSTFDYFFRDKLDRIVSTWENMKQFHDFTPEHLKAFHARINSSMEEIRQFEQRTNTMSSLNSWPTRVREKLCDISEEFADEELTLEDLANIVEDQLSEDRYKTILVLLKHIHSWTSLNPRKFDEQTYILDLALDTCNHENLLEDRSSDSISTNITQAALKAAQHFCARNANGNLAKCLKLIECINPTLISKEPIDGLSEQLNYWNNALNSRLFRNTSSNKRAKVDVAE